MRTFLIVLISAAVLVGTACKQSSSPAPSASSAAPATNPAPMTQPGPAPTTAKSNDAVQQKLLELAGSGASDCGRPAFGTDPRSASDCAMTANQSKRPFYVAYEMPGLVVGIAGAPDGKLYTVEAEVPLENAAGKPAGGAPTAKLDSEPCTAALRVAQSGRVTCMPPMAAGAGGNPHGGMPSGHGGMMSLPPGTPNPHGNLPTNPGMANPHGSGGSAPLQRSSN